VSTIELVTAYLRERYPVPVFVPLAIFVHLAGAIAANPFTGFGIRSLIAGITTAWLLVLAFRIGDDLADRETDRLRTPNRITARDTRTAPFVALAACAVMAAVLVQWTNGHTFARITLLGVTASMLGVWYSTSFRRRAPLCNAHVVLLKYPLIALATVPAPALATAPGPALDAGSVVSSLAALGALYLGLCLYETLHDPLVRNGRGARPVMIAELALLVVIQLLALRTPLALAFGLSDGGFS
jgi:hypothetical protein